MSGPLPTRVLVACDGAVPPRQCALAGWDERLVVTSEGERRTLNLKVDSLAGKVIAALDTRALDLIRIAACCYAADQRVRRGAGDVHREHWRRAFTLCVPVADPDFWSDFGTAEALRQVLGFGTDDAWEFVFSALPERGGQVRMDLEDRVLLREPDAVALFSGGTDSLCALVEAVADHGMRPIVVSHRSAPHIDRWQRDLLEDVRTHLPGWQLPHMSFWVHGKGVRPVEGSQRSRGFLFAALGAAVAGQVGVGRVLLPDNGYVSTNPPISGQLVGVLASRGTHPAFLRLVNRLLALVFPTGVVVENPLADRTRAEAFAVLGRAGVPELLVGTRSCGNHRGRGAAVPHCGGCSQCVDRRVAAIAAGMERFDPVEKYGLELFTDPLKEGSEGRLVALSYAEFARETEGQSSDALFLRYPELVACLDADHPDFSSSTEELAELMRRHAAEVVGALAEMYGRHRIRLARRSLPPTSLLVLYGGTPAVVPDPATANGLPVRPLATGAETEVTVAADRDGGLVAVAVAQPDTTREELDPKSAPEDEAGTEEGNYLRHRLGVWHVGFRGVKATYLGSKGMGQLSILLEHRGQELEVVPLKELVAVPYRRPAAAPAVPVDEVPDDEIAPDKVTAVPRGPIELALDAKGLERARRRKRELPVEIATAKAKGQVELEGRKTEELDELTHWLRRMTRAGGGARPLASEAEEKARKAVSKNIRFVLERIDVEQPELRTHLDASLYLGVPPRYDPNPPEHWRVAR